MEIAVIRAGMQTTVQDLGRRGHRAEGVPLSGAMDPCALRVANALVGNAENAAALEFALVGPELEFSAEGWIALGGAECEGLPNWRRERVRAGQRLALGACRHGSRGYLAVAGGIDVPVVLGSRSTYVRGGFGGFAGRALRDGDILRTGAAATAGWAQSSTAATTWRIDPRVLPAYSVDPVVRVVVGADAGEFAHDGLEQVFRVSNQSDRMGVRLAGPSLEHASKGDLMSSAVAPGTVQVPPDGLPLVLMADAQTIGGYPQIAHVITTDLPLVAQLRPGDTLRFTPVSVEEAHRLWLAQERAIALLKQGLAEKLGGPA